jgi:cytochrome c553
METAKKPSGARCFVWIVLVVVFMIDVTMATSAVSQDNAERGDFLFSPKKTFVHYCSPCHGPTGKGDGRYYAASLTPKPADLTAKEISARDDEYLFDWISRGSAAMGKSNLCPPWSKTMQERHIRAIIDYIKKLVPGDED